MPRYPKVPAPDTGRWLTPNYFLRAGVVTVAAGVAATLLALWFSKSEMSAAGRVFLMAIIYSVAIGMPCSLLLPPVGVAVRNWSGPWRLLAAMATIVVLIVAGCFAAGLVHVALGLIPSKDFWEMYWFAVRISVVVGLGAGLASYLYESLKTELERTQLELRTKQLDEERARKLLAQAQLSSLESRIHPHFLFNTLNSIASLIPEDPKRAEDMIGKLAALLRFSLEAHQRPLVPLRQELKIVRDYLEIESARLGTRLRYSIDVPPELEEIELPPLAIESLVENSIKHAIAPRREGGEVRVRARAAGSGLEIEVSDSGPGFALDSAPPGHGLDNLRGRLGVLYGPGGARIETSAGDGFSSVRIGLKV